MIHFIIILFVVPGLMCFKCGECECEDKLMNCNSLNLMTPPKVESRQRAMVETLFASHFDIQKLPVTYQYILL